MRRMANWNLSLDEVGPVGFGHKKALADNCQG